jgi:CRP/FNR family transcriptional regulator
VPATPSEEVLRRLTLFRRLSAADRGRVASMSQTVAFERGATILTEGVEPEAVVGIVDGHVKLFKSTPAGKEIILDIVGAGEQLGALAVFEGVPYPASAMALEHTTCVRIPRREFFALLDQHPAIVRGLLSGLSIRLTELTWRLAELSGARVEARFARLFLKLVGQIGRQDRGGEFVPMALSRQELADLTGTTIETTIRIMSRWQKEDVLHTEKDGFVILNHALLEDVAQT